MLPRGSPTVLAIAGGLLVVHTCTLVGGALSKVTIVVCAFALMVGGPIAILAWIGSLPDLDEKRRQRRRLQNIERSEASLWQRTLLELEPSASAPLAQANYPMHHRAATSGKLDVLSRVVDALAVWMRERNSAKRPVLALLAVVASALGFAGCSTSVPPPEAWAHVRPGMGTTELVAVVGGPDYVRSNGTAEVWQYCRDSRGFPGRDEGRYAKYFTAVLVDGQVVREVHPYRVASSASCEDYYRADF